MTAGAGALVPVADASVACCDTRSALHASPCDECTPRSEASTASPSIPSVSGARSAIGNGHCDSKDSGNTEDSHRGLAAAHHPSHASHHPPRASPHSEPHNNTITNDATASPVPTSHRTSLPLSTASQVRSGEYGYISHGRFFEGVDRNSSGDATSGSTCLGISAFDRDRCLDRFSVVVHIIPFAITGVCVQFLVDKLFGPEVASVTNDTLPVFIDLPANMLGSFLLGVFGVVFLPALLDHSRHLAVAVIVGLCGSVSTFATWNQRMLAIAAAGLWVRAAFGYFTGAALPLVSLVAGVDAATALQSAIRRRGKHISNTAAAQSDSSLLPSVSLQTDTHAAHSPHPRRYLPLMLLLSLLMLLAASLALAFLTSLSLRTLALSCLLAPIGTCTRYWLQQWNGASLAWAGGDSLAWVPWGTLTANVGAATVEAAISTVYLRWPSDSSALFAGALQLGFLACLSTVSMPALEALYLHGTLKAPARAYLYAIMTILPSFAVGIVIYAVPVWHFNYDSLYNRL